MKLTDLGFKKYDKAPKRCFEVWHTNKGKPHSGIQFFEDGADSYQAQVYDPKTGKYLYGRKTDNYFKSLDDYGKISGEKMYHRDHKGCG